MLDNQRVHEKLRAYFDHARTRDIAVGRYVMMPDHLHLFGQGQAEFNLGIWIRGLKRTVLSVGGNWQPGFFDHVLRSDESYGQKWNYIKKNPVGAGLGRETDDWALQGEIAVIDRV
ncbi:MAG: hypothetical protein M3R59_05185 [Verrucomicrobiota bacterium]|nr:hypothetical protein [Verrucomicrobiota bacterium]